MEIQACAPADAREAMVVFLWQQRRWPFETLADYYRAWDWRYTSLSDGEPRIWLAYENGEVVGHIAAYFRRYRLGERELRVAVPGNIFVRADRRDTLVGARLAMAPRSLVRSAEVDLVIAYGNAAAHRLFLRLGFHDLGRLDTFADVRRWGPALRRRIHVAAAAGPLLDAVFRIRRARRQPTTMPQLSVRQLTREQVLQLNRSHWGRSDGALVADDRPEYLARRYLDRPFEQIRLFGLFDTGGQLQGYVAPGGGRSAKVWDCQANPTVLDEITAVAQVADAIEGVQTVRVPLLPGRELACRFTAAGYLHREPTDYVEANTWWSAYWQPRHEFAHALADTRTWKLWFGANHY